MPKKNTFDRVIGIRNDKVFKTTNSEYGEFAQPETKFKQIGLTDHNYNNYFNCMVGKNTNPQSQSFQHLNDSIDQWTKERESKITSARESLRRKVIYAATNKGWLGYRKFKLFLKSLSVKHDMFINQDSLKYFFGNFGVLMDEYEIDFVLCFFKNSRLDINYEDLLNSFIVSHL